MQIEYELKFLNIDKAEMRKRLKNIGAQLIRSEFLQKRKVYDLPHHTGDDHRWMRVRDEQDKVTLNIKSMPKGKKTIDSVKEIEVDVSDFEDTCSILESMGCILFMYQENKRELWGLDDVELTIDTWPGLDPFLEIEAASEQQIRETAALLDLDFASGIAGSVMTAINQLCGANIEDLQKIDVMTFEKDEEYRKLFADIKAQSESARAK